MALRALARLGTSGQRFLGIEQYADCHTMNGEGMSASSSLGKTRIYRRAYFENKAYVPWIEHSLQVFRQMEQDHNVSLMQECGCLLMEPGVVVDDNHHATEDDQSSLQLPPLLQASMDSAVAHDIPVEFLNATELKQRFPQFSVRGRGDDMVGLLEPHGGFLRPERILKWAQREAQSHDEVALDREMQLVKLQRYRKNKDDDDDDDQAIQLTLRHTGTGSMHVVETRRLLLALGPWTGQYIPSWDKHLTVIRQVQGWIQDATHSNLFGGRRMPAFVMGRDDFPTHLYGVPCDNDDDEEDCTKGWFKVGLHKQTTNTPLTDPSSNHPTSASPQEIAELQQAVAQCINPAGWRGAQSSSRTNEDAPTFVATQPCMYTMSPDKDYIIGSPAGYKDSIVAVAGLSGHGFKMTPALGQILADCAMVPSNTQDVLSRWQAEFCSPQRFGG